MRKFKANKESLIDVMILIEAEYREASSKHPKFNSPHEGFAVIHEEFDELKAEVWKRKKSKRKMRSEAVQLAAMAIRFITDAT